MSKPGSQRPPRPTATFVVEGARVNPVSKCLVAPAEAMEEHWLSLSNLDRIVNPTFSSVILFYRSTLNSNRSFGDVTSSLKDSLAKVLVKFFPLAGRLALRNDGSVDLHCNDKGALFIEAFVEAKLSAVGGAKPMPELSGLKIAKLGPGPTYIPDQIKSIPVLVVMVTKFECGSVAVAANWHHTVADGLSGRHFMQSWAEVASGNPLSLNPNHDRFLIKARTPSNTSLARSFFNGNFESAMGPADRDWPEWNRGGELRHKCLYSESAVLTSFTINKDSMNRIRESLISSCESPERNNSFTLAESISAYSWWQMTRLRADQELQIHESTSSMRETSVPTRFFMFVDGRRRLNLPAGYFGNVMCSACSIAREGDILRKPLSYAASLIRKATQSITEEYFRSLIDWVEIQGTSSCKLDHMYTTASNDATMFCTFLPSHDMDFGWGKPELAARNSPPRPLIVGIALMFDPAKGEESMVALWNLHPDLMHRLQSQDSFKAVFS